MCWWLVELGPGGKRESRTPRGLPHTSELQGAPERPLSGPLSQRFPHHTDWVHKVCPAAMHTPHAPLILSCGGDTGPAHSTCFVGLRTNAKQCCKASALGLTGTVKTAWFLSTVPMRTRGQWSSLACGCALVGDLSACVSAAASSLVLQAHPPAEPDHAGAVHASPDPQGRKDSPWTWGSRGQQFSWPAAGWEMHPARP